MARFGEPDKSFLFQRISTSQLLIVLLFPASQPGLLLSFQVLQMTAMLAYYLSCYTMPAGLEHLKPLYLIKRQLIFAFALGQVAVDAVIDFEWSSHEIFIIDLGISEALLWR